MKEGRPDFLILAVMDGWGLASDGPGNAVTQADTRNVDRFWMSCPHTQLRASGEAVGLPRGEAGNTETGHLNLGAGRIVYQYLARINMSISDGSFHENKALVAALEHAKTNNSNLHIMGLVGAGGVHSNIEHLFALISLAKTRRLTRVCLHLFTDGRDSPPNAAKTYLEQVMAATSKEGVGKIATIMGRYWAMDRDRRWDRTAKAYFAMTAGEGKKATDVMAAIDESYAEGKTDEFIEPVVMFDGDKPVGLVGNNDAVIFFNFRIDRPRQLTAAFVIQDFKPENVKIEDDPYMEEYEKTHITGKIEGYQSLFERGPALDNLNFTTMTSYSIGLIEAGAHPAFEPEIIDMPLGKVISSTGGLQLRMAESEKERFVTYYFNGQTKDIFPGEQRLIIPSPNVATYDLKPEMSANEITDTLLAKLPTAEYKFVLVNYANPDMVGHTGSIGPAKVACETVDNCIGRLAEYVLARNGVLVVTADHGNAEEMINLDTGSVNTEHSRNNVPFIVVGRRFLGKAYTLPAGILADVAPTCLALLGIDVPQSMSGRNLMAELLDVTRP
ncbi:MAG: 2,3-bisphosphoglycerate-independent phosphoglycerate mutase [Dehalococcoidales bacterium]|nr:2,3-bisphosphoglycerate-independent phosphoglycerate mutase [Dehalococcoidales bacterium]